MIANLQVTNRIAASPGPLKAGDPVPRGVVAPSQSPNNLPGIEDGFRPSGSESPSFSECANPTTAGPASTFSGSSGVPQQPSWAEELLFDPGPDFLRIPDDVSLSEYLLFQPLHVKKSRATEQSSPREWLGQDFLRVEPDPTWLIGP